MKSLFLVFHGLEPHNGISKKILYQKRALEQCGLVTNLCYFSLDQNGYHRRMIDDEILENYGKSIFAKIRKRIQYSKLTEYILKNDIRLLYIRSFHNANPFLIHMIKKLRLAGVKSVLEIPTYPYDHEYKNATLAYRFSFLLDKIFRNNLAKHIYRIITFSDHKTIFGTPTINISNGIDFDFIKMKTKVNNNSGFLHLLGVAEVHYWHGFDRVITGLAAYYQKRNDVKVFFDVVGYGELEKLKALVIANHLQKYVRFHGSKSGEELDQLFENADMGIGSLARHRSHITYIKPLKNREYAARGIPFVYSEIDDDFENMPYVMKAPADETALDIEKIVDFFYKERFEPMEIRKTIMDKLSWKEQMGIVIDTVLNK